MLRREMLLAEPYRQLRYHAHRRRVASASAVVDAGPPVRPRHVVDGSRRLAERHQLQWRHLDADIRLMRALAEIMDSKRMDNDNTDFEKYRRLLQGSRTRSVDRTTPLPPPPELYPLTDDNGKPLRLCQTAAARPRSPSPLGRWPDAWLIEYRHQKQLQLQQQQKRRRLRSRRRRRRRREDGSLPARTTSRARSVRRRRSTSRGRTLSRGRTPSRPRKSEAALSDADDSGADDLDRDADESDEDADESGVSDADGWVRLDEELDGERVGSGRVVRYVLDMRSDPEAKDRLRRHGMVLMKGITGCQCAARKAT